MKQPSDVLVAVNGGLMRGFDLNRNLLAVNGTFVRETATEPAYRLWSINDRHPAMVRVKEVFPAVPNLVSLYAARYATYVDVLQSLKARAVFRRVAG